MRKPAVNSRPYIVPKPRLDCPDLPETVVDPFPDELVQGKFEFESVSEQEDA